MYRRIKGSVNSSSCVVFTGHLHRLDCEVLSRIAVQSILTPHIVTLTRLSVARLVFPPGASLVDYSRNGFVIEGILNFTPFVCLEDFFLVNTQQHCRYLFVILLN